MLQSIISFAAVFTAVVLVHEFGHFLAARRSGIRVYEFSIGFPFSPRLFTVFRHRETEFTVRLLPFGGFVRFSSDGDEEGSELFSASYGRRALVLSAGSLFNIFFAFALFIFVFSLGRHLAVTDALLLSAKTVWEVIAGTILYLVNVFSGHGTMEGLSGPVGIAAMAGKAAGRGFLNLVYFTGMLSLSLGIMNLLPLPALDGGHLMMLLAEWIRKKPVNPGIYHAMTLAGLALFLILTVAVTYRDVVRLVG